MMGQYLLLSCLVPILTSYAVFLLSYSYLPRNIFVYIFIAGFFNGALAGSIHLVATGLFQLLTDVHDWTTIVDNYLIFILLLAFPEGLLNGMAVAVLSVFKPEWLRTFSDRDYIYNHYHKK
ncbi:arginine/ornithine antiporter ArcD [Vibrio ponticus]|nr:arginine/ornithine antiporter ArcD [Vibrio ponticus]